MQYYKLSINMHQEPRNIQLYMRVKWEQIGHSEFIYIFQFIHINSTVQVSINWKYIQSYE